MKWAARLAPLAVLVLNAGCAGNQNFRGVTNYVGSWTGPWYLTGAADMGQMTLTVSDSATLSGSFTDFTTGETGIIKGATHTDGGTNMSFTVGGTSTLITIVDNMQGLPPDIPPAVPQFTQLSADGTFTRPGGSPTAFTFLLDEASTIVPNPGVYTGTWDTSGSSTSGTLAWFVGNTGAISGTYTDSAGNQGTIAGDSNSNGNYVAAFIPTSSGPRIMISGSFAFGLTTIAPIVEQINGIGTYTPAGGTPQPFSFVAVRGGGGT